MRRSAEASGPYAESWLEFRELKPRTRALYRRQLDRLILPAFAELSIRDITPSVVRVWHSRLDPRTPAQRAQAYALLRAILSTAVADEIVAANPCRTRGAGMAPRSRRVEPATLDELALLVEHMPERYGPLVLIGAWCGLRFGELAELRRSDVDLTTRTIHVRRGFSCRWTDGSRSSSTKDGDSRPLRLTPGREQRHCQSRRTSGPMRTRREPPDGIPGLE